LIIITSCYFINDLSHTIVSSRFNQRSSTISRCSFSKRFHGSWSSTNNTRQSLHENSSL